MITTDSNFSTAAALPWSQPVIIAKLETSWKQARLSTSGDFGSPIANTADITTKPGSIIAATADTDILLESSYGTTTWSIPVATPTGVRIFVKHSITLISFTFKAKNSTANGDREITFEKIIDDAKNAKSEIEREVLYSTTIAMTTTKTEFTITPTINGSSIVLTPGVYGIFFNPSGDGAVVADLWKPNQTIWAQSGLTVKGFKDEVIEMGQAAVAYINGAQVEKWSNLESTANGDLFLKTFVVRKYVTSSYDSGWKPVKNQAGANSAPSGNPKFYMEVSTRGVNTITGRARGADDGSGTNPSSQFTSLADGATISATKAYYSLGVDITIGSNYADSPEVLALVAYEGTEEGFCKHEDRLFGYTPIVDEASGIDAKIDPERGLGEIAQPTCKLGIYKIGASKTVSQAEQIIQNNYINNSLLTLLFGFASIVEGSFISFSKGLVEDYEYDDSGVTLKARDSLIRSKDPFGIDSVAVTKGFTIDYVTPTNAILQLMKLTAMPLRLINDSEFTNLEASGGWMNGWEVFRPFKESITDIKSLINELCLIAGIGVITQEDGLVYPIVMGPTGYNHDNPALGSTGGKWSGEMLAEFTLDTAETLGKCKIQLSKRINNCRVHRGWWNETLLEENKDKTADEEWNEVSVLNYGIGPKKIIESKWIPINTQVSSMYLSEIVAQRMVHKFGYGIWLLELRTGHQYFHLQIGDCVSVQTDQILFKGFGVTETVRGQIIGKRMTQDMMIEWTIWIYENVNAIVSPTPTNQSTNLTFPGQTTTTIDLAWTAASPAVTGNIAVYKAGSAPTYVPANGRVYKNGEEVASGQFIKYVGLSSNTITGLTPGTTYHFALYAYYASAGIESGFGSVFRPITYKRNSPLTGSHATS